VAKRLAHIKDLLLMLLMLAGVALIVYLLLFVPIGPR
jgi:hypothetical protein